MGLQTAEGGINRTKLKEQLLSFVPGLRENKVGLEVTLSFEPDVASAVQEACESNDMSDGMCLARAADILRRELFTEYPRFSGHFGEGFSHQESVPDSLVSFVSSILGGSGIDNGSPASSNEELAANTIAQLIRFNSSDSLNTGAVLPYKNMCSMY